MYLFIYSIHISIYPYYPYISSGALKQLERHYLLDFMPAGLFSRLMIRMLHLTDTVHKVLPLYPFQHPSLSNYSSTHLSNYSFLIASFIPFSNILRFLSFFSIGKAAPFCPPVVASSSSRCTPNRN